jgi:hypothetical protein
MRDPPSAPPPAPGFVARPGVAPSEPALDGAGEDDAATEPLWLAFVNTDDVRRMRTEGRGDVRSDPRVERRAGAPRDVLLDFDAFVEWLREHAVLDAERAAGIRRRAWQQPAAAAAALVDARRVRAALRALAERGASDAPDHEAARATVRATALAEINRVLGAERRARVAWRSAPTAPTRAPS